MAWPAVKIKDCCRVVGGATPKREIAEFWGNDIPWVTPKDISGLTSRVLEDAPEYISKKGYDSAATYLLPKGSVLLTSRAPIGNVAVAGREMCTNQGFKSLVPSGEVDSTFLYYCMKRMARKLEAIGNGATFKEVSKSVVEEFEIPLPPLPEQKRIAAILDKADDIRRKRQQAIQLADEFLRSVFLDMFGDPITNPKGWKRHECKDLCRQITVGIVVRPASYYVDAGVPALRSLNVRANRIEQNDFVYFSEEDNAGRLAKTRVFEGDIVLVRSGQPGTAAVVPPSLDGVNAIDILIARPKQDCVDSVFLAHFFNSPGGRALVLKEERGQIQKHLNVGSLSEALIPLPPLQEQERFRKIVERVSLLKQRHDRSDYEELFASLSQHAFRGDL